MVGSLQVAKVVLALKIECRAETQFRIDRVIWKSTEDGNEDQSVENGSCSGVALQRKGIANGSKAGQLQVNSSFAIDCGKAT